MLYYIVLSIFIASGILLIILVLLQKSYSEFALAYGSNPMKNFLGATEADTILTKITYTLGAIFLFSAILLNIIKKTNEEETLKKLLTNSNKTAIHTEYLQKKVSVKFSPFHDNNVV